MINNFPNKHVCMPVLSLSALILFKIKNRKKNYIIHYEQLPKYIRGIIRIFHINNIEIEKKLSTVTSLTIRKIQHGDVNKKYGNIRIGSYVKMVNICELLIPTIKLPPKSNTSHSPSIKFFKTFIPPNS